MKKRQTLNFEAFGWNVSLAADVCGWNVWRAVRDGQTRLIIQKWPCATVMNGDERAHFVAFLTVKRAHAAEFFEKTGIAWGFSGST